MSNKVHDEARGWFADCGVVEHPDDLADVSDAAIERGIDRGYEGGWDQFRKDVTR